MKKLYRVWDKKKLENSYPAVTAVNILFKHRITKYVMMMIRIMFSVLKELCSDILLLISKPTTSYMLCSKAKCEIREKTCNSVKLNEPNVVSVRGQ